MADGTEIKSLNRYNSAEDYPVLLQGEVRVYRYYVAVRMLINAENELSASIGIATFSS